MHQTVAVCAGVLRAGHGIGGLFVFCCTGQRVIIAAAQRDMNAGQCICVRRHQRFALAGCVPFVRHVHESGVNTTENGDRDQTQKQPLGVFSHYSFLRRTNTTMPPTNMATGMRNRMRNTKNSAVVLMTSGSEDRLLDGMETEVTSGCI